MSQLASAPTLSAVLDAHTSDPAVMGWMTGSPPPPDKVIQFANGGTVRFPQTRWSYSHVRQMVPTTNVSRGYGPVCPLPDTRQ